MQKKNKKAKSKSYKINKTSSSPAPAKPRSRFNPWLITSLIIFAIAAAAYNKYISSMVSQILLVATVVIFTGYQRYCKYQYMKNRAE